MFCLHNPVECNEVLPSIPQSRSLHDNRLPIGFLMMAKSFGYGYGSQSENLDGHPPIQTYGESEGFGPYLHCVYLLGPPIKRIPLSWR